MSGDSVAERVRKHENRVAHLAAEIMIQHPDVTLTEALIVADFEDRFIHGDPSSPLNPRGIMSQTRMAR